MTLPIYLTINEATQKYDISQKRLRNWLKRGKIDAIEVQTGDVMVSKQSIEANLSKDEIIQLRYPDLVGVPITLTDAQGKYGVPRTTIFNWVKTYGYVRVIKNGYGMTLDEADVAYCANIYKRRKQSGLGHRGAPLLDDTGREYQLKRPGVAEYRHKKRIDTVAA